MVSKAELREILRGLVKEETGAEKRALGNLFAHRIEQLSREILQYQQLDIGARLAQLEQGHLDCQARKTSDDHAQRIRELELAAGKASVRVEYGDWFLRAVILLLVSGFGALVWLWIKNNGG